MGRIGYVYLIKDPLLHKGIFRWQGQHINWIFLSSRKDLMAMRALNAPIALSPLTVNFIPCAFSRPTEQPTVSQTQNTYMTAKLMFANGEMFKRRRCGCNTSVLRLPPPGWSICPLYLSSLVAVSAMQCINSLSLSICLVRPPLMRADSKLS